MEVTLRATKQRIKKKVMRDHHWYDHVTKQRLHGTGGQMIFVYDPSQKRMVPRIIDSEEYTYKSNYDDIIEWVSRHNLPIVEQSQGYHVIVDVNPSEWSDLEDDLYRNKIPYEEQAIGKTRR